jgi:hypothetical protein
MSFRITTHQVAIERLAKGPGSPQWHELARHQEHRESSSKTLGALDWKKVGSLHGIFQENARNSKSA